MSGVGENLTKSVTVPLAGIGTAAVATAANFESSMSQVQATMGISKDAMSEVNGNREHDGHPLRPRQADGV